MKNCENCTASILIISPIVEEEPISSESAVKFGKSYRQCNGSLASETSSSDGTWLLACQL